MPKYLIVQLPETSQEKNHVRFVMADNPPKVGERWNGWNVLAVANDEQNSLLTRLLYEGDTTVLLNRNCVTIGNLVGEAVNNALRIERMGTIYYSPEVRELLAKMNDADRKHVEGVLRSFKIIMDSPNCPELPKDEPVPPALSKG